MKRLCVGIDIAKDKFDVTYTVDNQTFFGYSIIENNKKGIKKFVKQAEKYMKQQNCTSIHFCMEATGIYHCELCEYLQNSAHRVSVVNPVCIKSFSKSLLVRTKNDKVDSKIIAQYVFSNNPPQTPKLPEEIKNFRSLVRYKETLTEDRTREIARLKSSRDSEVKKLIQLQINYVEKRIKDVIHKLERIIEGNELLKELFELLITVPCISFNLACKILSELNYENIDNISPKALVANSGLSPKQNDSGRRASGKGCISRIGNSNFRKAFFMPALSCIHSNNYFTEFYLHLINNGKPKKVAITAVMRKILLTAGGVLRTRQPFDPNWAKKVQIRYQENLKVA